MRYAEALPLRWSQLNLAVAGTAALDRLVRLCAMELNQCLHTMQESDTVHYQAQFSSFKLQAYGSCCPKYDSLLVGVQPLQESAAMLYLAQAQQSSRTF